LFSNDATKTAETLQKYIEFRRERGSRAQVNQYNYIIEAAADHLSQIVDALLLLLPESPFHSVLSTLPPPDPANPTSTTTLTTQEAVHNSLPILEEIITLTEKDEDETIKKEVDKRRMRLGASAPEELKKEINIEVLGSSKVGTPSIYIQLVMYV
jgi:superkiller protein 3